MNTNPRCFIGVFFITLILPFPAAAAISSFQELQLLQPAEDQSESRKPDEVQPQSSIQPEGESQTDSGPSQNTIPEDSQNNGSVKNNTGKNDTSNDRLFWTLPNYLTVENARKVHPLTSREKFKLVLRTSFDWVEFPYIGFLAGINQAQDSESGYAQGSAGYFRRFGSSFADNTDENFWTAAILPSLLHQDPRYYQLGSGGFLSRACYALTRQFITRSDLGQREFNFSEVAGSAVSAAISNIYHPAEDRTFTNTVSVWWTQVGWDTISSVVKEFWPDIRRKVSKHRTASRPPDQQ